MPITSKRLCDRKQDTSVQTIGDIMTHPVTTVRMDDYVKTIQRIFEETGFNHLVVKKVKKPVGVISIRDLLRNLSPFIGNALMERSQDLNTLRKCAHQIMHRDLVTVQEHVALIDAGELLLSNRVTCLPVVDGEGHLRGIVTWRDLLPLCFNCELPQNDTAEDAA